MKLKANINAKGVYSASILNKITKSAELFETIVNSAEFKDMIVNMPDKWRIGESSKYKNKSGLELYNHILSGKEERDTEIDYEADIIVDEYRGKAWSKVVGFMSPGKPTIHINNRFYYSYGLERIVSNLLHEWLHTMGFRHYTSDPNTSFAYYANYIVKTLYPKLIEGEIDLPKEEIYTQVCSRKWFRLWIKKCRWVKI